MFITLSRLAHLKALVYLSQCESKIELFSNLWKHLCFYLQSTICVKQLAYSMLEQVLVSVFPELHDLILDIHQKACNQPVWKYRSELGFWFFHHVVSIALQQSWAWTWRKLVCSSVGIFDPSLWLTFWQVTILLKWNLREKSWIWSVFVYCHSKCTGVHWKHVYLLPELHQMNEMVIQDFQPRCYLVWWSG